MSRFGLFQFCAGGNGDGKGIITYPNRDYQFIVIRYHTRTGKERKTADAWSLATSSLRLLIQLHLRPLINQYSTTQSETRVLLEVSECGDARARMFSVQIETGLNWRLWQTGSTGKRG